MSSSKRYHLLFFKESLGLNIYNNMMIDIDMLLAWGAAFKKSAAGEPIFNEGAPANFYHQLVSGSVRYVNINEDGKEFIHTIIEPGDCFGELPLFDKEPYAATAIAEVESVIIRLHISTFLQFIKENPEIHFQFSRMLSQRIRFKLLLLKEFSRHDPEHSISALFNHFKLTQKNICPDCHRIKLTRQQIANMTGLRVETVIRTIRNLHHKGQLHIEKGKVYC